MEERNDGLQADYMMALDRIESLEKTIEELRAERTDKIIPKTPFALGDEVWVTYRKYNDKGEVRLPVEFYQTYKFY